MAELHWSRVDAPGGGLQAYHQAKWRLDVLRSFALQPDRSWRWELRRIVCGAWRIEAYGCTKRQRDAKHLARCALELHVGDA